MVYTCPRCKKETLRLTADGICQNCKNEEIEKLKDPIEINKRLSRLEAYATVLEDMMEEKSKEIASLKNEIRKLVNKRETKK